VSLFSNVLRVHEKLYKATDGRVGHRLLGVPTLLLRTTGRRSGVIRTNGLVYARDGADYLVVASKGGSDQPPAWLLNLKAKPEVEIQVGRERQKANSRVVEPSDPDYARLWKIRQRAQRRSLHGLPERNLPPDPGRRNHAGLRAGRPQAAAAAPWQ
jgi:deazaflavin-dependent oxidoreductase (nitroreductase family)